MLDGNDLVLLMDADSQLSAGWIASAVRALQSDRKLGGVCGTYLGVKEKGILRQLQRNEFVRASRLVPRRGSLWVLSGTGTMFRARVLREVGRERGSALPGTRGEFYHSRSITEDYEITLAAKTLGWKCIAPPGGWPEPWRAKFAAMAYAHGAEPFVQIEPVGVTLKSIINGRWDSYLRSYAWWTPRSRNSAEHDGLDPF